MRQLLIFCLLFFYFSSCQAQEPLLIHQQKVNWQDYPPLYKDASKTIFKDRLSFLEEVSVYEMKYRSDELEIEAFMTKPNGDGPFPVIIFNRGGNRDFGALQLFKADYKYPVAINFSKMAKEGYLVIGCNYRGGGKSQGEDQFGGDDVNDVLNLIKLLDEIPEADRDKIGIYGWSRGAMMTFLTLVKSDKIKAVVVGGGHTDMTVIDRPAMEENVYAELILNYWENKEEELKKRSAVHFVDQFPKDVPILILHGNADWRVKSTNSLYLALELEKYRIPYRLKIFEGADHGIREFLKERDQEVMSWFDRFLRQGEAVPDMEFHGN